jgi:hypothetical protein
MRWVRDFCRWLEGPLCLTDAVVPWACAMLLVLVHVMLALLSWGGALRP